MYSIDFAGAYRVLHSFVFRVPTFSATRSRSGRSERRKLLWRDGIAIVIQNRFERDRDDAASSDWHLAGRVDSGSRRAPVRVDGLGWPPECWHHHQARRGRDPHHGLSVRRHEQTERRDPGTQRAILWDHESVMPGLSQGRCSQWMPRAHARPCTRSKALPSPSPTTDRCRTCSRAPTVAWYGTTFNTPSTVFATKPGQIFRISPTGEFTTISSAYWLRAGVIQARDGGCTNFLRRLGGGVHVRVCLQSRSGWHGDSSPPIRHPLREPCRRTRRDRRWQPVRNNRGLHRVGKSPATRNDLRVDPPPGRSPRAIVLADLMAPTQSPR